MANASGHIVSSAVFLKKERDEIWGMTGKSEEYLSIERADSNELKAEVIDLTGLVIKIKELFRIPHSKGRLDLAEVRKMTHSEVKCYVICAPRPQRCLSSKHAWLKTSKMYFLHFRVSSLPMGPFHNSATGIGAAQNVFTDYIGENFPGSRLSWLGLLEI